MNASRTAPIVRLDVESCSSKAAEKEYMYATTQKCVFETVD